MKTVAIESGLTAIAENIYIDQHDTFVHDFTQHLKGRIESGLAQFKDGLYMPIEASEVKLRKELFQ